MGIVAWMNSPGWLAAGSIMLHFLWVGAVIGVVAAVGRMLLRSATAKARYAFALACFIILSLAPVAISVRLAPASTSDAAVPHSDVAIMQPTAMHETPLSGVEVIQVRSNWDLAASYLPWLWLLGTPLAFLLFAAGLIGTAKLRRGSEILADGDIPVLCRRLAGSLGIGRKIAVGICRHITSPILVGIARPLILLPPAALTGWSMAQVEMVLLHELAHVRRWDSLVNLLQRVVEAILFFHPAVWWLSAWIRLERELCCDEVVVRHTGRPRDYAETLASFASFTQTGALAIAESNLVTRIRCILKMEDRSMKISIKPLALLAALAVAAVVGLHIYAWESPPAAVPIDPPQQNELPKGIVEIVEPGNQNFDEVVKVGQPLAPIGEKPKADTKSLTLRGNVAASEQANLYARLSAPVDKVSADIGDSVKKGQVLATLFVPEAELELKQKKVLLAQAELELVLVRRSAEAARAAVESVRAQIRVAEGELAAAKAQSATALLEVAEAERAFRLKQITEGALHIVKYSIDKSKALEAVAAARVDAAKANALESEAKLAGIEGSKSVVSVKLDLALADLETTRLRLQHATILAPFDGVVIKRGIDPGSFVSAAAGKVEPLFTIARAEPALIVIYIPEANIGQVRKGTAVRVLVDAYPTQTLEGRIARMAPTIDPRVGALRAEIELNNVTIRLLPGMTAQAKIALE